MPEVGAMARNVGCLLWTIGKPHARVKNVGLTTAYFRRYSSSTGDSSTSSVCDHLRRHRPQHGLSYLHNASDIPYSTFTVPGALVNRARGKDGHKNACSFLYQNVKKTYAQLNADADQVALGLVAMGFQKGDRIAIWGPNSYEWLTAFFGISKIGAIAACLNPGLKANEVEFSLNKIGACALFAARSFRSNMYYPSLLQLFPTLESKFAASGSSIPSIRHVFALERTDMSDLPGGLVKFDALLDYGTGIDNNSPIILDTLLKRISFDDVVNIQFTSGTTGAPKAVQQTHFNVVNNTTAHERFVGLDNDNIRIVSALPFFHSFSMTSVITSCVVNGLYFCTPAAVYDAVSMLRAIESEKCNTVLAVPTMVYDLLNNDEFEKCDLSSLRGGSTIIGGSPCPPTLADEWSQRTGTSGMMIGYGMTESSPTITCGFGDDTFDNRCNTIGYPLRNIEVKIAAPGKEHEVVPLGEIGEICTRGFHVMPGYYGDEKKTKETITVDGWLKTGDLGSMTAEGYIRIEGRIKELIIRGGENVYPGELENILLKHAAVKECYVIGVPDERLGEEICAVIRVKSGSSTRTPNLERDLRTSFHAEYAAYKVPRYYWILDDDFELPTTTSGKVQKLKLKELASEKYAKGVQPQPTVNENRLHGEAAADAGAGLGNLVERYEDDKTATKATTAKSSIKRQRQHG